jgi:antitoxin component YwqK of YwqJK toxin-antitoxin module
MLNFFKRTFRGNKKVINKNGLNKEYNHSGDLSKFYFKKNGDLHGIYKVYFNDGKTLRMLSNYNNGELHGSYEEFAWSGVLTEESVVTKESNYNNGKLHGSYKEFDRSGVETKEFNYNNGKLHGSYSIKEGFHRKEANYKNGKLHGSYQGHISVFDTKKVSFSFYGIGDYNNGIQDGFWKENELETYKMEGFYVDGKKDGEWKYYPFKQVEWIPPVDIINVYFLKGKINCDDGKLRHFSRYSGYLTEEIYSSRYYISGNEIRYENDLLKENEHNSFGFISTWFTLEGKLMTKDEILKWAYYTVRDKSIRKPYVPSHTIINGVEWKTSREIDHEEDYHKETKSIIKPVIINEFAFIESVKHRLKSNFDGNVFINSDTPPPQASVKVILETFTGEVDGKKYVGGILEK